jgi:hypothetical protein
MEGSGDLETRWAIAAMFKLLIEPWLFVDGEKPIVVEWGWRKELMIVIEDGGWRIGERDLETSSAFLCYCRLAGFNVEYSDFLGLKIPHKHTRS